jgi:hypothetical protein
VLIRLLIIFVVALFLVMWVRALVDVVRRRDLSILGKVAWAVAMLVFPFIGLAVYSMLRPADSQIAQRARR